MREQENEKILQTILQTLHQSLSLRKNILDTSLSLQDIYGQLMEIQGVLAVLKDGKMKDCHRKILISEALETIQNITSQI